MSTGQAGFKGQVPTVLIQPAPPKKNKEKEKYEKCWNVDAYRGYSPGEQLVDLFLESAQANLGVKVIDWGCGTGRGGYGIHKKRPDLDITFVDIAENCLDEDVATAVEYKDNLHFVVEDLTEPSEQSSQLGYCTDVLEHLPEKDVDKALANILQNSRHVFFMIATEDDSFGKHPEIDDHLHLCVHDYHWWLNKFAEQHVVVHNSKKLEGRILFYVSGWGSLHLDFDKGKINTSEEQIISNIRENSKLGLKEMVPYGPDPDVEVMLLCGGPTLSDFEDEIIKKRAQGVKLITTNGSYNWAISKGLEPSLQCIVDAREFNKRFTEQCELTKKTQFGICSQCSPEIFKNLPLDRTYMWHGTLSEDAMAAITECYGEQNKDWFPIPGGSTIGLRALCLLQMLGFRNIYIYGLDSCVFPDRADRSHHAYEQEENDYIKGTIPMVLAAGTKYEKTFQCQPWQVWQLREFEYQIPRMAEVPDLKLQIKGDGAVAYMIESAAKIAEDKAREN